MRQDLAVDRYRDMMKFASNWGGVISTLAKNAACPVVGESSKYWLPYLTSLRAGPITVDAAKITPQV